MKPNEQNHAHINHTLICGVTMSGKTTMAHLLAENDARKKKKILVFDPVLTPTMAGEWPDEAQVFNDEAKFVKYLLSQGNGETSVYIDEAGDLFSHTQQENRWILTRGRHLGYTVHVITQRPTMVHPSVRNQCSRLFMFRLKRNDAAQLGADFGHNGLEKIPLDNGDFIVCFSGHAKTERGNVFNFVNRPKDLEKWSTISKGPSQQSS